MAAIGQLQVRSTASKAQLPLENVAIRIVDDRGKLLALRLTDSSGNTTPIRLEVPERSDSQAPDAPQMPYVPVNIYARAEGYAQILVRGVQIFAGTLTVQELNLVPLSEMPGSWNETEIFETPPQNL